MPGILYGRQNRREFLAASAAATTVALANSAWADDGKGRDSLRLALLSDTHIPADETNEYRGFRPVDNLRRIVPDVVAARPAATILNGDAARLTGEAADYERLKALLAPVSDAAPVYVGLGNHDNRDHFFRTIDVAPQRRADVEGKHVAVLEHPVVRVVVLDSLLYVDRVAGLLGKAQRTWLAQQLQTADDRPTVLFLHHTLGDGDGDLLDVDRLFALLAPHKNVKALFYGHSHVYEVGERQGIRLVNLPALGYNFRDEDPVGWVDATFTPSGVELTLHAIGGNMSGDGRTTSLRWT